MVGIGAGLGYRKSQQQSDIKTGSETELSDTAETEEQPDAFEFELPEVVVPLGDSEDVPIQGITVEVLPHFHTDTPAGADSGTVMLPKKTGSFLNLFLLRAHAQKVQGIEGAHRILAYIAYDQVSGQNQVFFYDYETGESSKLTDENEFVYGAVRIIDAPISAILYWTTTSFKLLRLTDLSVIKISGKSPGAFNYFSVSSDRSRLAYFDESVKLIVRDLTQVGFPIVKTFPNPMTGKTAKGTVAPVVFSSNSDKLYFLRTHSFQSGGLSIPAEEILSIDIATGVVKVVLSDDTQKRPLFVPFGDSSIYYSDSFNPFSGKSGAAMNKFDPITGTKVSIPMDMPSWNGLYFKNRVLIPDVWSGGPDSITSLSINQYDFNTVQFSVLFTHQIDRPLVFLGLGSNENEFLLWGDGNKYFLYDINVGTLRYLFTAQRH